MGYYEKLQMNADKLLTKRGLEIILRREVQGTYNPSTGSKSVSSETDYPCFGLLMAMDSTAANQFYSTGTLRETSIKKTDKLVLLSAITEGVALDIEPDPMTDQLVIKGEVFDIVNVVPIEPGGVPLIYYIQVRK